MFTRRFGKFVILLIVVSLLVGGLAVQTARAQNPKLTIWLGDVGDKKPDKDILDRWAAANKVDVQIVYGPQSATEYLAQLQQLLAAKSTDIDVLQFDVIWPGILAPNMLDLSPAVKAANFDTKQFFARILANNTVDGKIVGLPWFTDAGLLYYRTDLLKKYNFAKPPATWTELEKMAQTIQDGERKATSNNDFWGFVWQGNSYEGLTCDAIEWQFSNGGGSIVEADKTISVNNPAAIAAIERAAKWVGTISPKGVTTYQEEDARKVFQAGNAAFMRNWPYAYVLGQGGADGKTETKIKGLFDIAPLPAGDSGAGGAALGGWQLGVSAYSKNPDLAAKLAIYLASPEQQKERAIKLSNLPTIPTLYKDADVLKVNPQWASLVPVFENASPRPSTVTSSKYNDVSVAYFTAVNKVLKGESKGKEAFEDLEANLLKVLGSSFKVGKPAAIKPAATATAAK